MAYKVIAAFYDQRGGSIIRPGADYTPPTDEIAEVLLRSRCIKAIAQPKPEPVKPEVEVAYKPKRRYKRGGDE